VFAVNDSDTTKVSASDEEDNNGQNVKQDYPKKIATRKKTIN
jgi:hypothetical protein